MPNYLFEDDLFLMQMFRICMKCDVKQRTSEEQRDETFTSSENFFQWCHLSSQKVFVSGCLSHKLMEI